MEFAALAVMLTLGPLAVAGVVWMAANMPAGARAERRRWDALTARRVVVALKSGAAVDGILVASSGAMLTIRDAVLHSPGSDAPAIIDGEAVVLRDEVEYMQFPSSD